MRRAARIDATAPALIAYAESLGFLYIPINGVIDGVLQWGDDRQCVIDWKSPGAEITAAQSKLMAKGVRVRFIHATFQLDQLRDDLQSVTRGRP